MFCKHCGQQLDDNAAFCSGCGNPVGANPKAVQANYAAPPPAREAQGETVLAEGKCQFSKNGSFLAPQGSVAFTDTRIIHYKHGVAKLMVLGMLSHLTQGKYDFEIPYSAVVSVKEGRQMLSRYLDIHMADGKRHRIYFLSNADPCIAALRQAAPQIPFM